MTIDEFTNQLDKWGSDLNAWPERARVEGSALLTNTFAARQVHRQVQRIDALLMAQHHAPTGLRDKILRHTIDQQPVDHVWQDLASWLATAPWKVSLAATCLLALGFAGGFIDETGDLSNSELEQVSMLTFSDNYQEIEDAF